MPADNVIKNTPWTSNSGNATCPHCGEETGQEERFCCHGCETAYNWIHSLGLEQFYQVRNADTAASGLRLSATRSYAYLDDPRIWSDIDGRVFLQLRLENITCAACNWVIRQALQRSYPTLLYKLHEDPTLLLQITDEGPKPSEIAKLLHSLGYPCTFAPYGSKAARASENLFRKMGVAGAAAANTMMLALPEYFAGIAQVSAQTQLLLRAIAWLVTLGAIIYSGREFLMSSYKAAIRGLPHLDQPLSLALLTAFAASTYTVLTGQGHVYFDSITVVIFLILVARFFAARARESVQSELANATLYAPTCWQVQETGETLERSVQTIEIGDVVRFYAGDQVCFDGILLSDTVLVDESARTGEFQAVRRSKGDSIYAGSVITEGSMLIRVEAQAGSTEIDQVYKDASQVQEIKSLDRQADRFAIYFLIGTVVAVLFAVFLGSQVNATEAISRAAAVAIVLCPCAISLARPLLELRGRKVLLHDGIVQNSSGFLNNFESVDTIVFDKTGTLSTGQVQIKEWIGTTQYRGIDVRALIAQIEAHSTHPIARAIASHFEANAHQHAYSLQSVLEEPGKGIRTTFRSIQWSLQTASKKDVQQCFFPESPGNLLAEKKLVSVRADGIAVALLNYEEEIRAEAFACVQNLQKQGKRIVLLTGDQTAQALALANKLGISDVFAEKSPHHKAQVLQLLRKQGARILFVGDGKNDTAAMATATVSVAMSCGDPETKKYADAYLSLPSLAPLLRIPVIREFIDHRSQSALYAAVAYNCAAALFAILGFVSPLLAAIAMPLSSATVLAIALTGTVQSDTRL